MFVITVAKSFTSARCSICKININIQKDLYLIYTNAKIQRTFIIACSEYRSLVQMTVKLDSVPDIPEPQY